MSRLAEFRAAEKALQEQLAQLESLKNDAGLKKEIEFEEKLKTLIAEHEVPAACNLRSSVGVTQIQGDDTVETVMGRVTDALIKAKFRGKDTTDIL